MDPQSIDEFMNYILALKQNNAQVIQTLQGQIKNKDDEIKNLKLTSKPIKSVK
jgi:hypothetical protein